MASASTGEERWRTDLPGGVDAARAGIGPRIDPNTGYAVLTGGGDGGTVLDLADGAVIAEGADHVARDHVLDVTVFAAGTTVWGLEADGTEAWRHEDPEQLQFITAGERLAYARRAEEGTLVVIDTSQGRLVQLDDVDQEGPLGVPKRFSAGTASAVDVEGSRYLVTTSVDEGFGTR